MANDIVEYFLQMFKHAFQRWIWNGKTLDDGKWKDRTSYSNYSNGGTGPVQAAVMMSPVKELTFESKIDAEKVLKELVDTISSDGAVTVRTYYEASGVPGLCEANGVSSRSGWTDLSKAEIKSQPDGGFCISLPRPKSLSQNG